MDFPTLKDVRLLPSRGPWKTKSGGSLIQRMQLDWSEVQQRVFHYHYPEGETNGPEIRGLRIYTVMDIPRGAIGAREFHRLRTEIAFPIHGAFRWTCTDIRGERKDFQLNGHNAILVPPFILHEYESLEDGGALVVLATTTFEPEEPLTHDSYSAGTFNALKGPNAE